MQLILEDPNPNAYLAVSEVIDFDNASIQAITRHLRQSATTDEEVAQKLYHFTEKTRSRFEFRAMFQSVFKKVGARASRPLRSVGIGVETGHASLLKRARRPRSDLFKRALREACWVSTSLRSRWLARWQRSLAVPGTVAHFTG